AITTSSSTNVKATRRRMTLCMQGARESAGGNPAEVPSKSVSDIQHNRALRRPQTRRANRSLIVARPRWQREQALEGCHIGRLEEVMIKAGLAAAAAVFFLAPAGKRDQ